MERNRTRKDEHGALFFLFILLALLLHFWQVEAVSSPSPTSSGSPSPTPSGSPTSSPSPSSSPLFDCSNINEARPKTRLEIDYYNFIQRTLFESLTLDQPLLTQFLSFSCGRVMCNLTANGITTTANYQQRQANALDPSLVRSNYGITNIPCPVVRSYTELVASAMRSEDAVQMWWDEASEAMKGTTHYGIGVHELSEADDMKANMMVALVQIINDPNNCPTEDLPDAYTTSE